MTWTIDTIATELLACEAERREREPFTDDWPEMDIATAYAIQDETLRRRLDRGEKLIGVKLGLTSRAKQQRMGVTTPFVAWLTDAMVMPLGAPVDFDRFIHPRVEPEIVFVMGQRLAGPGISPAVAMNAVAGVHSGAEIIDSRYRNFRFTAADVIADNASSGAFIAGGEIRSPQELDLQLEAALITADGAVVDSATGAAIQDGHPGEALALAANDLSARGLAIEAGWLVLTGGMTDAWTLTRSTSWSAEFTNLGSIHIPRGDR